VLLIIWAAVGLSISETYCRGEHGRLRGFAPAGSSRTIAGTHKDLDGLRPPGCPLDENDPNLAFNRDRVSEGKAAYIVKVKRSDKDLVRAIHKLLEEAKPFYQGEDKELPRIYFDRHLYLPLLVQGAFVKGFSVVDAQTVELPNVLRYGLDQNLIILECYP